MPRHLLLRLASPLVAFGGETIDNYGVIRDFPALSMLTGLVANALGWDRSEGPRLDRLQHRLRLGTMLLRPGVRLREFQTAQLASDDKGWTTWGEPEERRGGAASYLGPHLRYRDHHADLVAIVALRLEPANEAPTIDDVAAALDRPKRPLFIGRKPCLPDGRLVAGWIDRANVLDALRSAAASLGAKCVRAQWPDGEGELSSHDRVVDVCDERNWISGLHGGWRPVREGLIRDAGSPL